MRFANSIKRLLGALPVASKTNIGKAASVTAMEVMLSRMRSLGFHPTKIVDIGAYDGEWSKLATKYWSNVPIVMLEAQEEKVSRLEEFAKECTSGSVRNVLLGSESGKEVSFYVMETGSSIYPEQTNVPRKVVKKQIRRLDEELDGFVGGDDRLLVKIDVQGAELDVIEGGLAVLDKSEFIIVEVSFLEYNKGGPLLNEVMPYLEGHGFIPFDIATMMRLPSGVLNQVDMLFCKADSEFRPEGILY